MSETLRLVLRPLEPSRSCGYPWVVLIDLDTTELVNADL